MQPHYHQKLLGQLTQALGQSPNITPQLGNLLRLVSEAYTKQDNLEQQLRSEVSLRTEQLISSTSRAYSFLDSLRMGFIMCDVNGEVVLANDIVRQLVAAKIIVDGPLTLATLNDLFGQTVAVKALVLSCLQTGQPIEPQEVSYADRVLQMSLAPMNNVVDGQQQRLGAVILLEDISKEKQLERSKDEFLSIASHELRTPLTAIRGNTALIQKYWGSDRLKPEEIINMVGEIHSSTIRLIEIVNDFLDASALEQGKMIIHPSPFPLREVIDEAVHELQPLCSAKGIQLLAAASEAAPTITADRQRIKQVLINLIGNAVKFTDTGSITISSQLDEANVTIRVADTGRGMAAESQQLLFRKFQQAGNSLLTRDTTKGTGLGLYISKLLVEQSGGRIWLDQSTVDQGSTFAFSLPLRPAESTGPAVSAAS